VKAYLKWAIYCATTLRKMRKAFDWEPFYDIARENIPYDEKLRRYGKLSRRMFEAARFEEFCARHLGHLDGEVKEFFATDAAKRAVRLKVAALFPAHEVEKFTELFWARIGQWRAEQP
jgi:hypothetical protein